MSGLHLVFFSFILSLFFWQSDLFMMGGAGVSLRTEAQQQDSKRCCFFKTTVQNWHNLCLHHVQKQTLVLAWLRLRWLKWRRSHCDNRCLGPTEGQHEDQSHVRPRATVEATPHRAASVLVLCNSRFWFCYKFVCVLATQQQVVWCWCLFNIFT